MTNKWGSWWGVGGLVFSFLLFLSSPTYSQVPAIANVKFPACDPVLIEGPQGRPIPNATVQVVNIDGSLIANGVYLNYTGTMQFNGQIPADQVLQVFADPGLYRTDISGAGITKSYYIRCGTGVGESIKTISIDRTPDLFLLNTATPPVLNCPINNNCILSYDAFFKETAFIDFVMPSFPLSLTSILLTYSTSSAVGGTAQWLLSACVYKTGEPPCNISIASVEVFDNTLNPSGVRNDLLISGSQLPFFWVPGDHVLFAISTSLRDFFPLDLQNLRLEFTRQ